MKLLASIFLALVVGCQPTPYTPADAEAAICNGQDLRPGEMVRIGDRWIHEGRLYLSVAQHEFRPCNKDELYLVDASFDVEELLNQYASTMSADITRPLYVRFHGFEMDCEAGLPDRFANVVKIEELLTQTSTPPPQCH